jgi:predicted ATP-dependent endonuclease of OLD family
MKALHHLDLRYVGPTRHLLYEPSERLNVITGDNSLGKTFLLDCAWWALTGFWSDRSALPREDASKDGQKKPVVAFRLRPSARAKTFTATYKWEHHSWKHPTSIRDAPKLVVYARYDGFFAVWDQARIESAEESNGDRPSQIVFSREELWDGKETQDAHGRERWLCNGLLLRFPYGEVPIVNCSAGIQRIVTLGYLLVWAWFEHLQNSKLQRRDPGEKLVILMDEVEAHLHPRWQRLIAPALLDSVSQLGPKVFPQVHLATHSPMVLAGVEVVADNSRDSLHHLVLEDNSVKVNRMPWVRRGRADQWLRELMAQ